MNKNLAPLQLVAVAFDNLQFDGRMWEQINELEQKGTIRVIDAVALAKTMDGDIITIEISDLPKGTSPVSGNIIRRILEPREAGASEKSEFELGDAMLTDSEYEYGMTEEELSTILEDIPRRGGMIGVLIEHLWALPLKKTVRESGGIVLAQDFLSPEALVNVSTRLLRPV